METRLDCRLVAVRLPEKVAQQRLRKLKQTLKKKGRTISERQRVMCQWLVLITNLPADQFTIEEICVLYRVRWQVELLFKRWKSLVGLGRSRGHRAYRVLCETYAKLLGCLVQHWGTLLRGSPLSGISAYRRASGCGDSRPRSLRRWRTSASCSACWGDWRPGCAGCLARTNADVAQARANCCSDQDLRPSLCLG